MHNMNLDPTQRAEPNHAIIMIQTMQKCLDTKFAEAEPRLWEDILSPQCFEVEDEGNKYMYPGKIWEPHSLHPNHNCIIRGFIEWGAQK